MTETLKFNAETGKILNLMINSLYTEKNIFLRELLSNASDACDKLRYLLGTDQDLQKKLGENYKIEISLKLNEKDGILIVQDSGIGMNKEDLISNLGTLARSGTERFMEQFGKNDKKDVELIGQFGVGFYSSFMVAEKVEVISRKAGEDTSYKWESEGKGEYNISDVLDEQPVGTQIILYLKDEAKNFTDRFEVKNIVRTYSDHIVFPIKLESDQDKQPEPEVINSSQAIWSKNKSEVKDEEYKTFYKTVSHSVDDPWMVLHNKNEGVIEFINLLFIPSQKPFDLFHPERKTRVKLYVKKVFVTEDNVDLIPAYLRFVKGIVDSHDLHLNISRDTLQNNAVIDKIRTSLVKRILDELAKKKKKASEEYLKFWLNFGAVVKEGLCEYTSDKEKIFDICLFKTSKSGEEYVSLDQYIDNMKEGQKEIYYLIGNDIEVLKQNPQLELFDSKDIEVIFLTDPVDDFWVTSFPSYKEKSFKSLSRLSEDEAKEISGEKNLDEDGKDKKTEEKNKDDKEVESLIQFINEQLQEHIKEARVTHKLSSSPACLALGESGMDFRMERMLIEQGQLPKASKKILEINPKHSIVKGLVRKLEVKEEDFVKDAVLTLFDQACLIEGEVIANPASLVKRIARLLEASVA